MAGPWDKYQTPEAPQAAAAPWDKYKAPEQPGAGAGAPGLLGDTKISRSVPQSFLQQAAPYVRPALEMGGAIAGGALATPGTLGLGTVGGTAIGYAAGRQAASAFEDFAGVRKPKPGGFFQKLGQQAAQVPGDLAAGAAMEAGGQIAGKALPAVIGAVGKGARAIHGKMTGAGAGATEEAIKSGEKTGISWNPFKTKTDFDKALRGEISGEDIVDNAKGALQTLKDSRATDYRGKLAKIKDMSQTSEPEEIITPGNKSMLEELRQIIVGSEAGGTVNEEAGTRMSSTLPRWLQNMGITRTGKGNTVELIDKVLKGEKVTKYQLQSLNHLADSHRAGAGYGREAEYLGFGDLQPGDKFTSNGVTHEVSGKVEGGFPWESKLSIKDSKGTVHDLGEGETFPVDPGTIQRYGSSQVKIPLTPIKEKMVDLMQHYNIQVNQKGELDLGRVALGKTARNDVEDIIQTVNDWGSRKGDDSPLMLDVLKRRLDDFYSDSSEARQFVTSLRNVVKDTIVQKVPEYATMTKDYAEATKMIKDIEAGLMLKKQGMTGRIVADQTLRRLTSSMRDNFALRRDLVQILGQKAGKDLEGQIAGYAMRSPVPLGLAGTGPALVGEAALIKMLHPSFWPVLAASSPRVSAEFLRLFGKALGEMPGAAGAAGKIGGMAAVRYGQAPDLVPEAGAATLSDYAKGGTSARSAAIREAAGDNPQTNSYGIPQASTASAPPMSQRRSMNASERSAYDAETERLRSEQKTRGQGKQEKKKIPVRRITIHGKDGDELKFMDAKGRLYDEDPND